MPRFRPDGALNALHPQRLKDKLGNRSNASSEVEFVEAFAWRVGEEGRGVRTIIEMVQLTRLDCVSSSAGLMRMGLALAMHHARHRTAFQRKLVDQPAMRATLADLALTVEGAVALRLGGCRAPSTAQARMRPRRALCSCLMTPAIKFAVCKAAPAFLYEAMECLGGNGYVEESPLPRLYREAPVNAIWEGSGNIMALDLLRAAAREKEKAAYVLAELARLTHDLPGAAAVAGRIGAGLAAPDAEGHARTLAQRLAALAACAALAQSAPPEIADIYARTRLLDEHAMIGAVDLGAATQTLMARATRRIEQSRSNSCYGKLPADRRARSAAPHPHQGIAHAQNPSLAHPVDHRRHSDPRHAAPPQLHRRDLSHRDRHHRAQHPAHLTFASRAVELKDLTSPSDLTMFRPFLGLAAETAGARSKRTS